MQPVETTFPSKMTSFSFERGWSQVPQGRVREVRTKLFEAFKLRKTSRISFSNRLKGKTEPKISEVIAITEIFHAEGIKDIWGPAENNPQ